MTNFDRSAVLVAVNEQDHATRFYYVYLYERFMKGAKNENFNLYLSIAVNSDCLSR